MGFFLRKIGLLRETSCNEGRTEGKKWTAQEMVTQLAWKSSYFEEREESNGKGKLFFRTTNVK